MSKLAIFIIFSAVMLTLILVEIIPQMIIPKYDFETVFVKKPKIEKINYKIEKITDTDCRRDSECATPEEYLLMSRCPFASKCIDGKCAVVCPDF
jgi:hypothetical protein